ncbi:hypothetical protein ARMGADRAFT_187772 [Armillaria gallica]|uniref:Uncharacterized protein n=1 Tax=Armillaria gallica TaxID=47427 RepID=A0A2H3D954_ARMGA|nr:hypothetical protein ARMGADRAFT_187772 [Armillaria gallica]
MQLSAASNPPLRKQQTTLRLRLRLSQTTVILFIYMASIQSAVTYVVRACGSLYDGGKRPGLTADIKESKGEVDKLGKEERVKNLACDNPADETLEQELEVLNDLNEERIRLAKLRSKDKASKEGR